MIIPKTDDWKVREPGLELRSDSKIHILLAAPRVSISTTACTCLRKKNITVPTSLGTTASVNLCCRVYAYPTSIPLSFINLEIRSLQ